MNHSNSQTIETYPTGFWNKLIYAGSKDIDDNHSKEKIILSNRITLLIVAGSFLLGLILLLQGNFEIIPTFILLIVLTPPVVFLNRKGKTDFSRVWLSAAIAISIYLGTIASKWAIKYELLKTSFITEEDFYIPMLLFVFASSLPCILIDVKKWKPLAITISIYIVCFCSYPAICNFLEVGVEKNEIFSDRFIWIYNLGIIFFFVIVLSFVFLQSLNNRFEIEIDQTLQKVKASNEILSSKKEEQETAYNELKNLSNRILLQTEQIEKQTNELNSIKERLLSQKSRLERKTNELENKRTELSKTNSLLENQNEEIKAGILFSKHIQEAALPSQGLFEKLFENYFIYFKPKDIVSGDFYFLQEIKGKIFLAVADCTGHGVPGALIAMIATNSLKRIINTFNDFTPSEILEATNKDIVNALNQENRDATNDGMDIALCIIEKKDSNTSIRFAGAKRSLLYSEEDKEDVKEISGARKSIGGFKKEKTKPFVTHNITLNAGSVLYLFTDGYTDQNNTVKKKLGVASFVKLLNSFQGEPFSTRKELLETSLIKHQGDMTQRDDIAIIGIQL